MSQRWAQVLAMAAMGKSWGVVDIGDVATPGVSLAEGHQAHRVLGSVRPVGPQPDDAVKGAALMVAGMNHPVAGLLPQPAQPMVSPAGQPVEPGNPEVPQAGRRQRPLGQLSRQLPGQRLLVLLGLGFKADGSPLLGAQVKEATQLAWYQPLIPPAQVPQVSQLAGCLVQGALINACHLGGKRSMVRRSPRSQPLGQQPAYFCKNLL